MEEIYITQPEYPKNIAQISSPPEKLFLIGNKDILNMESIAIIGSRCCTRKGYETGKEFAKNLANSGLCIVSGLAEGIDSAAHEGALEVGGKTIAIIGSGLNNIFPKKNQNLAERIIKNDGAIITEYEKNVEVFSKGFVMRNRLIAGISKAILVIEAKYRSGTSITVKFAKQQKKQVFCLAHSIEEREGIGTNKMIQEGAYLVTKPNDILKFLGYKEKEIVYTVDVPKEFKKIYECITKPISVDEICIETHLPIQEINYKLTMMEIEGYIKQIDGKRYIKNVL